MGGEGRASPSTAASAARLPASEASARATREARRARRPEEEAVAGARVVAGRARTRPAARRDDDRKARIGAGVAGNSAVRARMATSCRLMTQVARSSALRCNARCRVRQVAVVERGSRDLRRRRDSRIGVDFIYSPMSPARHRRELRTSAGDTNDAVRLPAAQRQGGAPHPCTAHLSSAVRKIGDR